MRSGGLLVQQELAGDAAAVMRQALTLARRRGHAQVTPLHVAAAVLSDDSDSGGGGGLLRAACLRSRAAASHPLQCKALQLCFNVALNRLATAGGGPGPLAPAPPAMFQFHHAHYAAAGAGHRGAPVLSNALAAAFKRAQANQRRGGGSTAADGGGQGQGQQHVGAKVELEQLVISILDDPSVSRVMLEAGFSSAEVKANVEKAVSSSAEQQSSNTAGSSSTNTASPNNNTSHGDGGGDVVGDAVRVLDCMTASGGTNPNTTNPNRCVAVLGESAAAAERVVKAVMDRVSKGGELLLRRRRGQHEHEHERLRNAQFVPFSAASFRGVPREEVQARAGDLCALVRECCGAGRPVVLVLQDLGYAAEAWAAAAASRKRSHGLDDYCPVEHAVMELGRLVRGGGAGRESKDMSSFWMLGFGAYACYASCRSGQPSLETVLGLHPVVVPDGGLALCIAGDSEVTHCAAADRVVATATAPAASVVPSWIRRCQGPVVLTTGSELTLSFSSPASSSHGAAFTTTHYDTNYNSCVPWHDPMNRQRQPLPPNHRRHDDDGATMAAAEPYDQLLSLANPNNPAGSSNYNSVSKSNSSEGTTTRHRYRPKFTELTAANLKILCGALEARVPRHVDIAPGIASAVLRRRSGVTTRTRAARRPTPATWLLFQGRDHDGKVAMARELARLVFGSYAEFTCIAAAGDHRSGGGHKRQRSPEHDNEQHGGGGCMLQVFYEAIRENPHRVVLIVIDGGVEHGSEVGTGVMDAMATGTVRSCCDGGGVASLEDSIVVLCCEVFGESSRSLTRVSSSPPRPAKQQRITSDVVVDGKVEDDDGEGKGVVSRRRFSLDLNACADIDDGQGEEGSSSHNDDMEEILDAVDGVFFFY